VQHDASQTKSGQAAKQKVMVSLPSVTGFLCVHREASATFRFRRFVPVAKIAERWRGRVPHACPERGQEVSPFLPDVGEAGSAERPGPRKGRKMWALQMSRG